MHLALFQILAWVPYMTRFSPYIYFMSVDFYLHLCLYQTVRSAYL